LTSDVQQVAEGQILIREMRDKLDHKHFVVEGHKPNHSHGSGLVAASSKKHSQMAETKLDFNVIFCGAIVRDAC